MTKGITRLAVAASTAALILSACGQTSSTPAVPQLQNNSYAAAPGAAASSAYTQTMPDGTVLHMMLPRATANTGVRALAAASGGPVVYHGGIVMHNMTVYAIFWQPTGRYMSALYKPTIEQFFKDVGNTTQYGILTQYTDKTGPINNSLTLGGAWTDTSAYPSNFGRSAAGDTDLHNEVLKAITKNGWTPGNNSLFAIFTAQKAPDDSWAACAYHASFLKNSTNYIYTIVPYQHDYGAQGCGTPSTTWPNDRDADQTIDTLWHETAEAASDPITSGGAAAWYAANGSEIGDICQTSYGPIASNGSDTVLHGDYYVTQELWSNKDNKCMQHE